MRRNHIKKNYKVFDNFFNYAGKENIPHFLLEKIMKQIASIMKDDGIRLDDPACITHFKQHLIYLQSKESFKVPESVLLEIMDKIYNDRILDPELCSYGSLQDLRNITRNHIYKYMKDIGAKNLCKYIHQIHHRITGTPLFKLNKKTHDIIVAMFIIEHFSFDPLYSTVRDPPSL